MVSLQDFQASEPFDASSPRSGVTECVSCGRRSPNTVKMEDNWRYRLVSFPAVLCYHRTWWHFRDIRYSKGPSSPFPLLCHRGISVKEEEMVF